MSEQSHFRELAEEVKGRPGGPPHSDYGSRTTVKLRSVTISPLDARA
jgi:hypothetical protein